MEVLGVSHAWRASRNRLLDCYTSGSDFAEAVYVQRGEDIEEPRS
jgi:hypothetical protein